MKAITIKSKTIYTVILFLFLGAFASFGGKDAAAQGSSFILSDDLFGALEPGNPVVFDRILMEHNPAWADFRQIDHGEERSAGVIFFETSAGPELGTAVNPAVVLLTYGMERNWELPANGDLVAEVEHIRATLHQHRSDWVHGQIDQRQYPVTNAATFAIYRYFNGKSSKLSDWSSSFEALFGVSPKQKTAAATTAQSTSSTVATPFLQRPFEQLAYPFRYISSFFDHHYPLYTDEGDRTDMSRFDGTFFDNIPSPDNCGYNGDTGSGNYCYSGHPAYDYVVAEGTPVKAAAAGHIIACVSDYGALFVEHENGLVTSYLHMNPLSIPDGISCADVGVQQPYVDQGQTIGYVSNKSPTPVGVHLHFGVGHQAEIGERHNTDPFGWWGADADPWETYTSTSYTGYPSDWLWLGDEAGDGYLTVDNMETQAQLFNPPSSGSDWNHLTVGYRNDSWWSTLTYQPSRTAIYWAIWGVNIEEPGIYEVQAYWPSDPDTQDFPVPTQKATYTLYYHDVQGNIQSVTLYADQSRNADQFTSLCAVPYENDAAGCPQYPRIEFGTGSSVIILRDVSEESVEAGKYMVFFDAVRWQQKVRDLAFVVDDTGSMGDEIDIVKSTTNQLVDIFVQKGISPKYHLVTYKDFPEVYYVGGTSDPPTIKGWLNNLSASGGGDCPEEMLGALELAAGKAPHSESLVLTDASFHGGPPEIAATASKLNAADVKVHIISYGNCGTFAASTAIDGQDSTQDNNKNQLNQLADGATLLSSTSDPFAQITSESGGHYFRIVTSETDEAINILMNEMIASSDLVQYTDEVVSASPKTYNVSIDSTVTKANFLLNMLSGAGSLTLIDPNGMTVNPTDPSVTYTAVTNAKYYQIANPVVGVWQAQVNGDGTFAFSTSGNSSINFAYLSDTSLAKNVTVNLLASLTGPVSSASFQVIYPDGTLLQTVSLFDDGLHGDGLASDGTYGGAYTPTTGGNFYIRVVGTTADDTGFERISTTTIRVQTLNVVAPADQTAAPGATEVYDFSITNGGTSNETYDLVITSSQGWADLSGVPSSISVTAGATGHVLIPVNVPTTATEGTTDELVLSAVSELDPLMHDSDSVQTTVVAPTFPTSGILDNFNRANGSLGSNWYGNTSGYNISSNKLLVKSKNANLDIYWNNASFGPNQEAYFTFSSVNATSVDQDLILKSQYVYGWAYGLIDVQYEARANRVVVWTYDHNQSWVQYGADIPVTFVNGDQFGARALSNGALEVYRNGVLIATRDISAWPYNTGGGYIGLWFGNAKDALVDDFGGGTIP